MGAALLAGCGEGAPTPPPGAGAVGLVEGEGAGAAQPYGAPSGDAGGMTGQAPTSGPAAAPTQEITTTPGAGR